MKFKVHALLNAPSNKMYCGGLNPAIADRTLEHEVSTPNQFSILLQGFIYIDDIPFKILGYHENLNKMTVRGNLPDYGQRQTLLNLKESGWRFNEDSLEHYGMKP